MSGRKRRWDSLPSVEELMRERTHERYRIRYRRALRSTLTTIITVAAIAIIISYSLMPVLRIYGHSMTPTVHDGNIVLAVRSANFTKGDVVAFYYNNKILVKRVIANPGDWVDIDKDGNVYVNSQMIEEPYLDMKAFGDCNIKLPYQVPESRIFVMGDNRDVSVDSRNTSVGCVAEEQIVGKIVFCIWPFSRFGKIQ
jgi:signal peptidase I